MPNVRLSLYAVCHFLVDFSCALLLLGVSVFQGNPLLLLLCYNFLAFAVQMPLGLLADALGRPQLFAGAGCLLAACAWLLPGLGAPVAAGLGNALFHVGGGLDTLNRENKKYGARGIFVSPGALGVFLGGAWSARARVLSIPVGLLLLGAAVVIFLLCRVSCPTRASLSPLRAPKIRFAFVCLFLVVLLRSYLGAVLSFPWKDTLGVPLVCAVVLGKALGGLLADRIGLNRTVLFSLLPATALFLISDFPPAGLAAVLLFNMTMPLTLGLAARVLPGGKGFAFGACTFALFLGFLPPLLEAGLPLPTFLTAPLCALLSLALLLRGGREAAGCS